MSLKCIHSTAMQEAHLSYKVLWTSTLVAGSLALESIIHIFLKGVHAMFDVWCDVRCRLWWCLQGWQLQAQQLAFGTGSPDVIPGAGKIAPGQDPVVAAQDLALERTIQVRHFLMITTSSAGSCWQGPGIRRMPG
jgi:hypothetical protein